ncbi:MAG: glycosyltransferase family 2 protein, partial [Ekhidna sp.]|nr:glycosyltransferase family 2 protein [Ekhidna sp.]
MSTGDTKRCYAIIVTYNGEEWIKDCLVSFLKSFLQPEILIIDNGSSDRTLEIIKSYDTVRLLENDENLGFGAANNLGLKLAFEEGAEYFFLVNQDVFIEENT